MSIGLYEINLSQKSSRVFEMKFVKFLIVYLSFVVTSSLSYANDNEPVDPLTIRMEQMKKGITKLIGRISKVEEQVQNLSDNAELVNSLQDLAKETQKQVGLIEKEMLDMIQDYENIANELAQFQAYQETLVARLSSIEKIIGKVEVEKRIPLGADGSAIIFKVNELQDFKDQLPSKDKCTEFGSVLENFPARSLNAFFVISDNNMIALCKLEYGMSHWSIVAASIADRGHV